MRTIDSVVSVLVLSCAVAACSEKTDEEEPATPASESEVVSGGSDVRDPRIVEPDANGSRTPTLGIEVRQGDRQVTIARAAEGSVDVAKIAMKAGSFKLRFPKQKDGVAIQITAWSDSSIFRVPQGASSKTHASFGEGTGIADSPGSGTLYLNDRGNNYLIDDRLVAISDTVDEIAYVQTFANGAATPLTAQKRDLFLAVFIDKNQNDKFDAGELEYLVLTF
jgi:hypothetical protein